MKKNKAPSYLLLPFMLLVFFSSCQTGENGEDDSIRRLEENSKLLETSGKIATYPLTIVISDNLEGSNFPMEIQNLCALSNEPCKTLPVAGILRLGPNNYYTYNNISELSIPESMSKNEAAIVAASNEQVNGYLSKAELKDYDSLLTPNQPDWNLRELSLTYINNTADSIFFFSQSSTGKSWIQVGSKKYYVYNDIGKLRTKINDLICSSHPTISVFYNFLSYDSSGRGAASSHFTARGVIAGDSCMGRLKYEKLHNGKGGYMLGTLLDANSATCAMDETGGVAGDTCISGSKYEKLLDGKGGFTVGTLVERNSRDCGFTFPTGRAGDTCISGSKYQKLHNGRGGFRMGSLVERNSPDCGFIPTAPVPAKNRSTKVQPEKGSPAQGFTCYRGSKYAKVHDGKGGFIRGAMVEENSSACTVEAPETQSMRKSEPICEQEAGGAYTGRRIQYYYNKSGAIIRTVVLSKCDADCRCIGG